MDETEEQLLTLCDLTDEDKSLLSKCSAPKRRIEILSVRALLKEIGINQAIHYNDRKPFVNDGYISISHSQNIAAIIWNRNFPVGIDVETISPRIQRIAKRAFSEQELKFAEDDIKKLTILWNCKECVFKLANTEGIDFRQMIQVEDFYSENINCSLTKGNQQTKYILTSFEIEGNSGVYGKKHIAE